MGLPCGLAKTGHPATAVYRPASGSRILDEYQILLPTDLAPGEYRLDVGMYDAAGVNLPAAGGAIPLGDVTIE